MDFTMRIEGIDGRAQLQDVLRKVAKCVMEHPNGVPEKRSILAPSEKLTGVRRHIGEWTLGNWMRTED